MSYSRTFQTLGTCLTFAFGSLLSACGSVEGYTNEDANLVGAQEFETHSEALFYEKAGSCGNYEAENMTRVGGSATTSGWRLSSSADSISTNHSFSSGEHTLAIVAWGSKGSGSIKPQIRLKLNGYTIGDVTVTNTSHTDGWREYPITYDVNTGNTKTIKVELLNPGQGRSVRIDGISVYCPAEGVICDGEPGCEHCYAVTDSAPECRDDSPAPQARLGCDQHSDCSGDSICAFKGSFFDGFGVGCMDVPGCEVNEASVPFVCRDICKSPDYPETPCSDGRVCTALDLNPEGYELEYPGWKFCVAP